MEIPFIPKNTLQKAEDPAKLQKTDNKKAAEVDKKTEISGDVVTISPKSRLLQKLRAEYGRLDVDKDLKVEPLKASVKIVEMAPEEIVHGILRGTLFEQI